MSATAAAQAIPGWLAPLANPGFPGLPNLQVPVLGNKWAVGTVFLFHVFFGSYTMGTLVTGPTYELVGALRNSPNCLRYADALGDANLKLFSLGATLAGFAVIFLAGLYGRMFIPLVETFFVPFLVAFTIWLPILAAMYVYAHRWRERYGRPWHIGLGYAAAAGDHVFLFMIVGVDSFLLTPGSGQGWGAFFNATFLPELGHRFVGNLSWSSLFLGAVFALGAGLTEVQAQREYRLWAARTSLVTGFLLLVPQAVLGFEYVRAIQGASPGAFGHSFGANGTLWLVQTALLCAILLGTSIYFAVSRPSTLALFLSGAIAAGGIAASLPASISYGADYEWVRLAILAGVLGAGVAAWLTWLRRKPQPLELRPLARGLLTAIGIAAVALFLLMGVIRTSARDPYTVYGRLTQLQSQGIFQPQEGHYP
jgi:hypothetical protein